MQQMVKCCAVWLFGKMSGYRLKLQEDQYCNQSSHNSHEYEWRTPAPMICKIQAERYAQHLACPETHLHKAHYTPAMVYIEQVGNYSQGYRPDNSAKQPGNDASHQQYFIRAGYAT